MDEQRNQQKPQQQTQGSRRRRRRPRRRRGPKGPPIQVEGFLWVRDNGGPLLVDSKRNFVADRSDPTVPAELVRPLHLESGLFLTGQAHSGDRPRMSSIESIEGLEPETYRTSAIPFSELISIDPLDRFNLETDPEIVEPRVAELIAPLGKGQRCLIVSPPKAGKTTLLQQMAHAIAINHPNTTIFVLLVDERPEEVTDWKRSIASGEVFASSTDQSLESHIQVSEMVFERARRLVEMGGDVVVFMDSLTACRALSTTSRRDQDGFSRVVLTLARWKSRGASSARPATSRTAAA
jgi:transcription termination factor Rho